MRLTRILAALAVAVGIVSCDDDPTEPDNTLSISIVSGGSQTGGIIGQAQAAPLVAKVTDVDGDPVSGVVVNWTVAAGGGTVAPASSTTDAAGLATATLTLGPAPGNHTVTATIASQPSASVSFTSAVQLNLAVQSGSGQAQVVNRALTSPLVAKVTNDLNQPVAGVTVNWSSTVGTVTPTSSVTNASGLATAGFTVGPTEAANTVTATLAIAPTVSTTFTANARWEQFTATMNSAGEPTNTGVSAIGTATYTLVNGNTINYTVDVPSGLTGTWTGLHIHAPLIPPATTVGVAVNLCPATVTCAIGANGSFNVSGSFTGSSVPAAWGATDQARLDSLVVLLRRSDGTAYTNLHTTVNTGGQIRGPVLIKPPTAAARREE
jgi:hypothetical protein